MASALTTAAALTSWFWRLDFKSLKERALKQHDHSITTSGQLIMWQSIFDVLNQESAKFGTFQTSQLKWHSFALS